MFEQKFIDSFNIILSDFQISANKIINKRSPSYQKLEQLALIIAYLKSNVYKSLVKFKKDILSSGKIQLSKEEIGQESFLDQQYKSNSKNFQKLNLHHILSRKILKLQKSSLLSQSSHSLQQLQNISPNSPNNAHLTQIKNSLTLLEADLGIQHPQTDQISYFNPDNSILARLQMFKSKVEISDYKRNGIQKSEEETKTNRRDEQLDKSISEVIHRSMTSIEGTPIRADKNGNEESMLNQSMTSNQYYTQIMEMKGEQKESRPPLPNKEQKKEESKKKQIGKRKKNKATVYSSKDKILDNLLEESYMSCYQIDK